MTVTVTVMVDWALNDGYRHGWLGVKMTVTVMVDWALKINYLSIRHGWLGVKNQLSIYLSWLNSVGLYQGEFNQN